MNQHCAANRASAAEKMIRVRRETVLEGTFNPQHGLTRTQGALCRCALALEGSPLLAYKLAGLVLAEHRHRTGPEGTTKRSDAGESYDRREQARDAEHGERVVGCNAVELTLHVSRQQERSWDRGENADQHDPHHIAQDQSRDPRGAGAEREPEPNLLAPARDRERHDAVEPHSGERCSF